MKTDITIDELRIGNLFRERVSGALLSVKLISVHGFDFHVIDRSEYPLPEGWEAKPIPLTKKWFLNFGFEYKIFAWGIGNLSVDDENRLIINDSKGYGIIIARDVLYVHQLQNLYFALTGEELIKK